MKGKGFLVFSRLQLLLQSVLTTLQVKANRETTEQTMADQKELQKNTTTDVTQVVSQI